jgi:hypothetical protein
MESKCKIYYVLKNVVIYKLITIYFYFTNMFKEYVIHVKKMKLPMYISTITLIGAMKSVTNVFANFFHF